MEEVDELLKAYGHLTYHLSEHSPVFRFSFPEVGAEVLVAHGFFRSGRGIVKSVDPDSADEKVVVTIRGKKGDFDVPYTFDQDSTAYWECVKGDHRIDSGASIAIYNGGKEVIDYDQFTFFWVPTQKSHQYFNK